MGMMRSIFAWASEGYNVLFADWLYIHYAARTLILLLTVWIIIYAFAQIFQYLIAPALVLFWYHAILRAWNFLVIETLQEWIYIHYYADDKPFLRSFYQRLCDIVKHNRLVLSHTKYTGILYRGRVRRVTARLMVILLIIASLWVVAFGLYNEYTGGYEIPVETADALDSESSEKNSDAEDESKTGTSITPGTITEEIGSGQAEPAVDPTEWAAGESVLFGLNRYGVNGANIRDLPGGAESIPVAVVNGGAILTYAGEYVIDENNDTLFWLKVRTEAGIEGYISNKLLVRK